MSPNTIFRRLLSLQGEVVTMAIEPSGETLTGKIENTMFDSVLLDLGAVRRVVQVRNILWLDDKVSRLRRSTEE